MPQRLQRKRTAGWRKPANCVIVSRPSRFGNPFTIKGCIEAGYADNPTDARKICVQMFDDWLDGTLYGGPGPEGTTWSESRRDWILAHLGDLRGKDIACYCHEGDPCHGDSLIKRSNRPDEVRELTPDNVHELFGWIESGKPHYAAGMVVDGLSVYGTRGREVALFGDFIVRDVDGFHVRKNESVTV